MNSNDFISRGRTSAAAPQADTSTSSPASNNKKQKGGFEYLKMATATLIFSIALLSAALLAFIVFGKGGATSEAEFIKADKYQAVFLNDQNGQVYFGRLSVVNARFYRLTDIFYVRVEQVQPDDGTTANRQNISLAKLGNELHGPEDEMFIARDEVLFWENLKEDGQVVEAIKTYKENGSNTTTNPVNTDNSTNTTNTTNTTTNTNN